MPLDAVELKRSVWAGISTRCRNLAVLLVTGDADTNITTTAQSAEEFVVKGKPSVLRDQSLSNSKQRAAKFLR
jgi:hypothetical protein